MGNSGGGFITQVVGFVLTVVGMVAPYTPLTYIGMAMMFGGSIWNGIEQRREAQDAMDRLKNQANGLKANTQTTQRCIPVIYGRSRVGGNNVYMRSAGSSNNDLHLIYGISEGPIDGFEEVWFNDLKVWDATSATSQTDSANDGKLQTPFKDYFSVAFRLGTNSQDIFWQVASTIDSNFSDRYPLTAMAHVKLTYNQAVYQNVPRVNFVIRGRQTTDHSTPSRPTKWTSNPVNALYDMLTDNIYGWGLPSSKINLNSVNSAAAYSGGVVSTFTDYVSETIDVTPYGPMAWSGTFTGYTTTDTAYWGVSIGDLKPYSQLGGQVNANATRVPIRLGALSISWYAVLSATTMWAVDTFAASNATTGTIVYSGGGDPIGTVNYLTGVCSLRSNWVVDVDGQVPRNTLSMLMHINWGTNYQVQYRTKYQYLSRSVYSWCGSETHTEVSCGILSSNSSGIGTVDYNNGIIQLTFGGNNFSGNLDPIKIYYKVQTAGISRFSYNGGLIESTRLLDTVKETATHFRGFISYADGQYYFFSDGPGSSIYSFNDDNILSGSFRISQAPLSERPNRIRVKYIDSLKNYTAADVLYESASPATVQADLREQSLELPGCVYRDVAHRMGQTLANQVALGNNVEFKTTLDASAVMPGNIIDITHPSAAWSGKLFRVYETNDTEDGFMSIRAIEHADSVYVDEWPFGVPSGHTPSFYPRRSYFPPAVTSLSMSEIPQTLSDGTTTPMLEVCAEANASSATVGGYKFWLTEYGTTSKAGMLFYSGPSNRFAGHVKPGAYAVTAHTYSEFDEGVLSAKGITEYIKLTGDPQYEWMNWRMVNIVSDMAVVSSVDITVSKLGVYLHNDADVFMLKATDYVAGHNNEVTVYKLGIMSGATITKTFSCHNDGAIGEIGLASSGHIGLYYWDANCGTYMMQKVTTNSMTTVASYRWTSSSLAQGPAGFPVRITSNSVGGFMFNCWANNSISGLRWSTFSTDNMVVGSVWTTVFSNTQEGMIPKYNCNNYDVWCTNSYFVALMIGYTEPISGSGYKLKISHTVYSNDMATCVVSPHQVYLSTRTCSAESHDDLYANGISKDIGVIYSSVYDSEVSAEGWFSNRSVIGIITHPTTSTAAIVFRGSTISEDYGTPSRPFITQSGHVVQHFVVSSPHNSFYSSAVPYSIEADEYILYRMSSRMQISNVMTWI